MGRGWGGGGGGVFTVSRLLRSKPSTVKVAGVLAMYNTYTVQWSTYRHEPCVPNFVSRYLVLKRKRLNDYVTKVYLVPNMARSRGDVSAQENSIMIVLYKYNNYHHFRQLF